MSWLAPPSKGLAGRALPLQSPQAEVGLEDEQQLVGALPEEPRSGMACGCTSLNDRSTPACVSSGSPAGCASCQRRNATGGQGSTVLAPGILAGPCVCLQGQRHGASPEPGLWPGGVTCVWKADAARVKPKPMFCSTPAALFRLVLLLAWKRPLWACELQRPLTDSPRGCTRQVSE